MMQPATGQPPRSRVELDEFLPFLIYRLMAKAAVVASADYAPLGISIQEARLLMLVLERPGIRAGELSEAGCVEPSALSHMMRHLVAKGLLRRERHALERRSVQIFLTAEGMEVARRCSEIGARHEQMLVAGLDGEEVASLRGTVKRMLGSVERQAAGAASWDAIAAA